MDQRRGYLAKAPLNDGYDWNAEDPASAQRRMLRRIRIALYGTLIIIVGPGVVAYFIHREEVPYTHRNRSMLISPEQEAHLGEQMLHSLDLSKALPPTDPRVIATSAIARRLVAAAASITAEEGGKEGRGPSSPGGTREWRVFVIDEPVRNAFAAPGGLVVIYRGMLDFLDGEVCAGRLRDREGAVAAVLAHEIGHVVARHSAEKISTVPLSFSLRVLLAPIWWFLIPLTIEWPYTRTLESEADTLGMVIMRRACYDASYAIDFYAASRSTPSWAQWLSTHPSDEKRAAAARAFAAQLNANEPVGAMGPAGAVLCPGGLQSKAHSRIEAMLTCGTPCRLTRRQLEDIHKSRQPVTGGKTGRGGWPSSGADTTV